MFLVYSEIGLIKIDSQGIEEWSQTLGIGEGYSVEQTTDGGYILTGYVVSFFGDGGWDTQLGLIKTDSQGNTVPQSEWD